MIEEDGERERGSSDVRWKTVPQMSGCNRTMGNDGHRNNGHRINWHLFMANGVFATVINFSVLFLNLYILQIADHPGDMAGACLCQKSIRYNCL